MAGQLTVAHFRWTTAISTTVSNEVDLRDFELLGLYMPSTFAGAAITFQCRPGVDPKALADSPYRAVSDSDGAAFSIAVAVDKYVVMTANERDMAAGMGFTQMVAAAQADLTTVVGILLPRG